MELLCVLFFAVLIVTLVGHGIWVTAAAVFRLLGEPPGAAARAGGRGPGHCTACGAPLKGWDRVCFACGLERDGPRAREAGDLAVAVGQVRALHGRGDPDPVADQGDDQRREEEDAEQLHDGPPRPA